MAVHASVVANGLIFMTRKGSVQSVQIEDPGQESSATAWGVAVSQVLSSPGLGGDLAPRWRKIVATSPCCTLQLQARPPGAGSAGAALDGAAEAAQLEAAADEVDVFAPVAEEPLGVALDAAVVALGADAEDRVDRGLDDAFAAAVGPDAGLDDRAHRDLDVDVVAVALDVAVVHLGAVAAVALDAVLVLIAAGLAGVVRDAVGHGPSFLVGPWCSRCVCVR